MKQDITNSDYEPLDRNNSQIASADNHDPKLAQLNAKFNTAFNDRVCQVRAMTGYNLSYLDVMVSKYGARESAIRIVRAAKPSYTFWTLKKLRMLHITIEALVVEPRWAPLFTTHIVNRAEYRLEFAKRDKK